MKKLMISPITQWWCDKKLLEAANKTALYPLARKAKLRVVLPGIDSPQNDPLDQFMRIEWSDSIRSVDIGGDVTYFPCPPGYGRAFPWPSDFVQFAAEVISSHKGFPYSIQHTLDSMIVQTIADASLSADRVQFKRYLTQEAIVKAIRRISPDGIFKNSATGDPLDTRTPELFSDRDGEYLICITSRKRIDRGPKHDNPMTDIMHGWEDESTYMDYIDRPLYGEKTGMATEYGRLKLADGLYVVFIASLDDRMMHALLFGPDAITVTPLEKNLHAIFRRTPAGEAGRQPRGIDVGYMMQFGAVADPSRCVVLEAEKAVEKV